MLKLKGSEKVSRLLGVPVCLECGGMIEGALCRFECALDGKEDRPPKKVAIATYRLDKVEFPPPKPVST